MTITDAPPRWDLTPIFGGLDDRAFNIALEGVYARVDRLVALYDELDIRATDAACDHRRRRRRARGRARRDQRAAGGAAARSPRISTRSITTDSRDDLAAVALRRAADPRRAARAARQAPRRVARRRSTSTRSIARSPAAAEHAFALRKAAEGAELQMSEQEESLAGRARAVGLARVAAPARRRLVAADGRAARRRTSTSACRWRSPAGSRRIPTPARRRAAYEGELEAWSTVAVPLAAALNGAKGELGVLNRRRGFADDLEPALRANNVDRGHARRDDRRGRRGAARASGATCAPRRGCSVTTAGCRGGISSRRSGTADAVPWSGATDRVRDAFAGYSPDLAALANRAFAEHWVDAETRDGKQGGAYCAGVEGDVSRIMMNFDGSQDSISTLAHELGHAFHNVALGRAHAAAAPAADGARGDRVDLLRDAALRARGAAGARDDVERLALLDVHLVGATQTVVDIHSRFLFETRAVRAPAAHDAVGRRPEGRDARRAGRGLRRRPPSRATATSTCGR